MPKDEPTADDILKGLSFVDDPPSSSAGSATAKPQRNSSPPRKGEIKDLEAALTQLFALPALVFQLRGDDWCASHMLTNAEVPARAWAKLAEQNPRIFSLLKALTTGGAYGEALMSTAAFVIPILAHHDKAPKEVAELFGVGEVPDWEGPNVEHIEPPMSEDSSDAPKRRVG